MSRKKRFVYVCDRDGCLEVFGQSWDEATFNGWVKARSVRGKVRHFCSSYCHSIWKWPQ